MANIFMNNLGGIGNNFFFSLLVAGIAMLFIAILVVFFIWYKRYKKLKFPVKEYIKLNPVETEDINDIM